MLAHEFVAIAVGQNNITYQHIKRPGHRPPLHFQSVTNPLSAFGANYSTQEPEYSCAFELIWDVEGESASPTGLVGDPNGHRPGLYRLTQIPHAVVPDGSVDPRGAVGLRLACPQAVFVLERRHRAEPRGRGGASERLARTCRSA